MAGVARVRQVIEQAKTTFKKAKGDATFQEEFERLKSLVSLYTPLCKAMRFKDTQGESNTCHTSFYNFSYSSLELSFEVGIIK